MSPPEAPNPKFSGRITGEKEYTGAYMVPEEEWLEACKHDDYLLQILDYIEQDKAYRLEVQKRVTEEMKKIRAMKTQMKLTTLRIESRHRQYKHFAKLLRKKMAFKKIEELRKDIGLS